MGRKKREINFRRTAGNSGARSQVFSPVIQSLMNGDVAGGATTPTNYWELEANLDHWQLEDASGNWSLE